VELAVLIFIVLPEKPFLYLFTLGSILATSAIISYPPTCQATKDFVDLS